MAVKLGVEVGDRLVATLEGAVGVDGLATVRGLMLVATSAWQRASAFAGKQLVATSAQKSHLSAADAAGHLAAVDHLHVNAHMLEDHCDRACAQNSTNRQPAGEALTAQNAMAPI